MDRVLLIDDDRQLAEMLVTWCKRRNLAVEARATVAAGMAALRSGLPDVLVLDVMLPDGDGIEVCREVRNAWPDLPILMLTARGDPTDCVVGLKMGADDYLSKPFDPNVLEARIRALLRRVRRGPAVGTVLRFEGLEIDQRTMTVRRNGQEIELTSHQFQVLCALAVRAGIVLDRAQLSAAVGEGLGDAWDRTIDVHISRIRAAIEDDPKSPRYIRTIRGHGYLFTKGGQ